MANYNAFSISNKYEDMTDEELLKIVEEDKEALEYLVKRYSNIVNMKANKFFMIGAEKEDMVQEGMIGLYKAIKSYNLQKQNSFKTFANMCIERQLITAVKNSNRQKHIPLNSSVSLNSAAYDENENSTMMDVLDLNPVEDPSDIVAQKEYYNSIEKKINDNLSSFEKQVLEQFKLGKSYVAIAEKLDTKVKSVDTAIQRVRKKAVKIRDSMK